MKRALCLAIAAITVVASAQTDPKVTELKNRADQKVRQISELTASGKLTDSDQALKLLQQLVDELKAIRTELQRLDKSGPVELNRSEKVKVSGLFQFQYQDTDRIGETQYDAFRLRRVRPQFDFKVDKLTNVRVSFEMVGDTNQLTTQALDAWIEFQATSKVKFRAGQQALPLGYELERSSADREMPEYVTYNRLLFPTERARGVLTSAEFGKMTYNLGAVNSLTLGDPEQSGLPAGPGNRLALVGSARYRDKWGSVGVSGLVGDRPAFAANGETSPVGQRRFLYVDGELKIVPKLTIRGEVMSGHDRVGNKVAANNRDLHPLAGYHVAANYDLSALDSVFARWESFDPNRDQAGDGVIGYGLGYRRQLSKFTSLTLSHEIFDDASRAAISQQRWNQTMLRLQVKF